MVALAASKHSTVRSIPPGTAYFGASEYGEGLDWVDSGERNLTSATKEVKAFWKTPVGTGTSMQESTEASDTLLPKRDDLDVVDFPVTSNRAKQVPKDQAQRILRAHFTNQLLQDLKGLATHCEKIIAVRYASSLLKNMRTARDIAPFDPFIDVVMAFHDALTFENRWQDFSADQYESALVILRKIGKRTTVSDDHAEKAIMGLEDLGFDTTPFSLAMDTDD